MFRYDEANLQIVEMNQRLPAELVLIKCFLSLTEYPISSFKRRGVYLILGLLGAAFMSKTKIEENEIMCQFKTIRYFLNHAV